LASAADSSSKTRRNDRGNSAYLVSCINRKGREVREVFLFLLCDLGALCGEIEKGNIIDDETLLV
jgi:hypothetical protein